MKSNTPALRPRLLALMLGCSLCSGAAWATNGYFAHGYGIKAKGMGGASVATAQDGFAGANNPAAAAYAGNRYDIGADIFMPERSMSRSFMGQAVAASSSDNGVFLVPEFGYNLALSDKIGIGLTVYGNGGMNTEYQPIPTSCDGGRSVIQANVLCGPGKLGVDLVQLIVAPTLAYKISPQHALGISPLLVHQRFKAYGLQAFDNAPGMPPMTGSPGNVTDRGSAGSNGVGLRLGYMGKLSDSLSIGAAYSPKINMGRMDKYKGLFAGGGDFDIPENYSLGLAWQASPGLLLALDHQRINYRSVASVGNASSNQAPLGADNGPGFGWRNINVWKIGVQWQANAEWTLRGGINHGDNPVSASDVSFNILAPGVIKQHITLGATKRLDTHSELSFSYMYALKSSVTGASLFNNPMLGGDGSGAIQETVRMRQSALGIQYSRSF